MLNPYVNQALNSVGMDSALNRIVHLTLSTNTKLVHGFLLVPLRSRPVAVMVVVVTKVCLEPVLLPVTAMVASDVKMVLVALRVYPMLDAIPLTLICARILNFDVSRTRPLVMRSRPQQFVLTIAKSTLR
jgi:predicted membrane protein